VFVPPLASNVAAALKFSHFLPHLTVAEDEPLAVLECIGPVVDKGRVALDAVVSSSEVDGGLADDGILLVDMGVFVDAAVLGSLELSDDEMAPTDVVVTPMVVISVGMLIEVDPRISR
jgi:hypothetical protein